MAPGSQCLLNAQVRILSFNKYHLRTHQLPGRVPESGWMDCDKTKEFLQWSNRYLTGQVPLSHGPFRNNRISQLFLVFMRFLRQTLRRPIGS